MPRSTKDLPITGVAMRGKPPLMLTFFILKLIFLGVSPYEGNNCPVHGHNFLMYIILGEVILYSTGIHLLSRKFGLLLLQITAYIRQLKTVFIPQQYNFIVHYRHKYFYPQVHSYQLLICLHNQLGNNSVKKALLNYSVFSPAILHIVSFCPTCYKHTHTHTSS